jgi:hypothetical protein
MRVCGSHGYRFVGILIYDQVFWKARNEIQCCTPGSDVPRLAVSSTPQEWEKTGRTLFTNKRYIQAMHCFERAGLDREAACRSCLLSS